MSTESGVNKSICEKLQGNILGIASVVAANTTLDLVINQLRNVVGNHLTDDNLTQTALSFGVPDGTPGIY